MARKVRWTTSAWLDLEATTEYIARDSAAYAAAWIKQIRNAARSLNRFAGRGRMVTEFEDETVRELIIGNYRLIYQPSPETVCIIGIIHGARDLPRLWQGEGRQPPIRRQD